MAETYLLRAEAYGRKGNYNAAIDDINKVRARAAFKAGETRAEVLARLQPGYEKLTQAEQQWPYEVDLDNRNQRFVRAKGILRQRQHVLCRGEGVLHVRLIER